jgi:xanthine dehydrogenase YagR molybdenum-binding subunit
VFTAGRILNAKTARSQAIGGMTFGVGAALMEAIVVDKRNGWFVNNNLAEYHVAAMITEDS